MRIFVIILLLVLSISLQVFAEISDTTNLLTIQELASLKAEEGIHFSLSEGNEYLLIESSGAPERTPSIYFGTIKVTPGNTYTYVVSSDSEMHCSAMLYVTSSHGNLVWPGSEIKDGLAINTFSIPQGTTEITLGIAFLYPIAGDAFQVKDVGLFAGIIDSFPQLEVKRKNVFFSLKNESPQPYGKNLFVIESIDSIKTEKSISFLPTDCLIVKSSGAIDQTPALYFGTVNVTPGETYSYIVKGNASKGSNISLYVMSSAGNIDIRDQQSLENLYKKYGTDIKLIIHTAAQPSHDWAAKEPFTDFSVNANGTLNLLEFARIHCPQAVFIFTSTNKVYGDNPNYLPLVELEARWEINENHAYYKDGIDESMSLDQTKHSIFGASKVAADILVQEYGRYFGMKTGVFRGGCLTGPRHSGAMLHGFLSYLMKCVITKNHYTIFGYKGKQVRDNIHSYDLVNMFWSFYQNPKNGEVYNAGGGRFANCSMLEAIQVCEEITGNRLSYSYSETNRIGDHIWYVSDVSKFKEHFPGWTYKYDLTTTLYQIFEELTKRK